MRSRRSGKPGRRTALRFFTVATAVAAGASLWFFQTASSVEPSSVNTFGPAVPSDTSASDTATDHEAAVQSKTFELKEIAIDSAQLKSTVEHLANVIGPRAAGDSQHAQTAAWLAGKFEEFGYDVELMKFALPDGTFASNVIARIKGRGVAPRPSIVIGAHFDTVKGSPGADDNASGVAVLLESARILRHRTFSFDVIFVAFGAEERFHSARHFHHIGSRALAHRMAADSALPAAMMSLDMVGSGPQFTVRHMGRSSRQYLDLVLNEARTVIPSANFLRDPGRTAWSDHEQFENLGVPVAWIERRPVSHYHSPRDVAARIKIHYLEEATQIVAGHLDRVESWLNSGNSTQDR